MGDWGRISKSLVGVSLVASESHGGSAIFENELKRARARLHLDKLHFRTSTPARIAAADAPSAHHQLDVLTIPAHFSLA